jgi:hypothetical protein
MAVVGEKPMAIDMCRLLAVAASVEPGASTPPDHPERSHQPSVIPSTLSSPHQRESL